MSYNFSGGYDPTEGTDAFNYEPATTDYNTSDVSDDGDIQDSPWEDAGITGGYDPTEGSSDPEDTFTYEPADNSTDTSSSTSSGRSTDFSVTGGGYTRVWDAQREKYTYRHSAEGDRFYRNKTAWENSQSSQSSDGGITGGYDPTEGTDSVTYEDQTDYSQLTVDAEDHADDPVNAGEAEQVDSDGGMLSGPDENTGFLEDKIGVGISDDLTSTDDALGGSITKTVTGTEIGISDDWTTTDDALDGQTITEAVTGRDIGISDDWTTTDDALGEDTTLAETVGETAGNAGKNLSKGLNEGADAAGVSNFMTKMTVGVYAIVALAVIYVIGTLFDIQV